jgi:hypothetical protein
MLRVFILFILTLFVDCNFGSVGNKLKENAVILDNLIRIVREHPTELSVLAHFYDDQADTDLSSFMISSGNTTNQYTVKMESGSLIEIERIDFRINPPEKPFGSFVVQSDLDNTQIKTHTPYTIPLDLPSNDPYGKFYSINSIKIGDFIKSNSSGIGLGNVSRHVLGKIQNLPQGIISQTNLYIKKWEIRARISSVSSQESRNLVLSLRDFSLVLLPRCRTELGINTSSEWILGFKYSSLFKDFLSEGTQVSLLQQLFSSSVSGETILISDLDPRNAWFFNNLKFPDNVIVQESCFQLR